MFMYVCLHIHICILFTYLYKYISNNKFFKNLKKKSTNFGTNSFSFNVFTFPYFIYKIWITVYTHYF